MTDLSKYASARATTSGLVTPWGIGSFVNIWEYEKPMDEGKAPSRFSITLLFKKGEVDLKALAAAADTTGRNKFKDTWERVQKSSKFYAALRDGNEKFNEDQERYAIYEDTVYIRATTKFAVTPLDAEGNKISAPMPGEPDPLYSGAIYRAIVTPWAYDNNSKGVSWNLQALQRLADGERLGRGPIDAAAAFGIEAPTKNDWSEFGL